MSGSESAGDVSCGSFAAQPVSPMTSAFASSGQPSSVGRWVAPTRPGTCAHRSPPAPSALHAPHGARVRSTAAPRRYIAEMRRVLVMSSNGLASSTKVGTLVRFQRAGVGHPQELGHVLRRGHYDLHRRHPGGHHIRHAFKKDGHQIDVIAEKIGYQMAPSVPQLRRELRVEGPARRFYGPAMACRDHYTEEPHFRVR